MFSLIIYFIVAAVGGMMIYLYKSVKTTAEIFKPDPRKFMKAFLTVFILAMIITFGLSYYTTYVLYSTPIPDEANMKFLNAKSIMYFSLNLSFLLLIILSNAYSLSLKKFAYMPFVFTALFYAIFILKDGYFMADYYTYWQTVTHNLKDSLPDYHSTGWAKCGMGMLVTVFNAFLVWFGLRK